MSERVNLMLTAVDECQTSPCGDHGVCDNQLGSFQCHCDGGWTGDTCSLPPSPCYLHQCQNNATCLPGVANYTCQCTDQFSGEFCSDKKGFMRVRVHVCTDTCVCVRVSKLSVLRETLCMSACV